MVMTHTKEFMQSLAEGIDSVLVATYGPGRVGFALMVFELGQKDGTQVNYISNADRESMIAGMKEWLARNEGQQMKLGRV